MAPFRQISLTIQYMYAFVHKMITTFWGKWFVFTIRNAALDHSYVALDQSYVNERQHLQHLFINGNA